MENTIGNQAIKIACMQVIPGKELVVKSSLEMACRNVGIKKYVLLKGFGTFDIILFYLTEDLGFHLSKAGPIPNVLKSNLLLCYPYKSINVKKVFNLLSQKLFTGVSLLKINPALQTQLPGIENRLRSFFTEETKWTVLGSLGWNEIILIINEDEIDRLCKLLFEMGSLVYVEKGTNLSILTKTLSFIGMNYKFIPSSDEIRRGFNRTKKFLDEAPSLKNTKIIVEGTDIYPTLEAAVKPMSMSPVKNYFLRKGFQGVELLGKQDLSFRPRKEMTWSHFIASVLHFRHKYRGRVFSTSIRLNLRRKTLPPPFSFRDIPYRSKPFDFDYTELEAAFGKTVAPPLANHFYSFNGLSQNPLCGSAFIDMMDYLPYIRDTGTFYHLKQKDPLPFAQRSMEALRYGAELRSYGTYDTIEEVTGRFSEFRGGCQQALLAIEFLPSNILERLKIGWKGFVVIGYHKFFHVNEVINVPTEDLWNPQSWWPLYHEIAHIVIDNRSDWVDFDLPLIQQFLANKDFPESWFMLLIELVAELIGFELGFFGDYRLFFEQLWNHLVKIDPFQSETVDIRAYVNRSFFPKIFEGHFRRLPNLEHITKKQFQDLDFLYRSLVTHMDLIEKTIGKPQRCIKNLKSIV